VSTSPFPWVLNEATHFPYFLLIVDVDKTFLSIGPFWHKAFKDALLVMLPNAVPDIRNKAFKDA
jgi:hypothetical protein